MAQEKVKKIHILNKYGPVSNAITGRSAGNLGKVLLEAGYEVTFFCINDSYKKLGDTSQKKYDEFYNTIVLKKIASGSVGWRRLASALIDGLRLTFSSLFRKADIVIVMTDPPMLHLWSGFHSFFLNRKVYYWTMDLYPDAFVAGNIVSVNNRFYQSIHKRMYKNVPDGVIALGQQQLTYLTKQYNRPINAQILPCGVEEIVDKAEWPSWINNADQKKIKFCYAGNIGEAHDERFLVSFIQSLNPSEHVMYINLYGAKAEIVLNAIRNLPVIKVVSFIPYGQMHYIDVHLASLLSTWDHVCVPSKAVSAVCAGAVLLLNTSPDCDNWKMLQDACWLIPASETGEYEQEIKFFLSEIDQEKIQQKKRAASQLATKLKQQQNCTLHVITQWLQ